MSVIVETTLGDLTVDLYVKERPRTCLNFLKLCKVKYYNYCLFHSVQRNFVAQTGDPTGLGRGGESVFQSLYGDQAKYFDAEVTPKIKHHAIGTVSMVNDGNGQHGSQFLITLGENLDYLDGVHSVFGEVVEGIDVLMRINETFCDKENRPFRDIRITHTVILDDPLDDPPGLVIPDRSPEPTDEQLQSLLRIGADEEIDENQGLTEQEVIEKEEKVEADHRAQVLEIIGDLPDKNVKPPDNVLFVCKLNPVTTDEDLEIIFSRFGTIVLCEIIRDYKSGDSLQYAFIEFSTPEECEKAYLKMDNVLIDDRRIHVDFSQSVSRMDYRRSNDPKLQTENSKGRKPEHSPPSKQEKSRHQRDRSRSNDRKRNRDYDAVEDKARKNHRENDGRPRRSGREHDLKRSSDRQRRDNFDRSHNYRNDRDMDGRSSGQRHHRHSSFEDVSNDRRHNERRMNRSDCRHDDRKKQNHHGTRTTDGDKSRHSRRKRDTSTDDSSLSSSEDERASARRKKQSRKDTKKPKDKSNYNQQKKDTTTDDTSSSSSEDEKDVEKKRKHRRSPEKHQKQSRSKRSSSKQSSAKSKTHSSSKNHRDRSHESRSLKKKREKQNSSSDESSSSDSDSSRERIATHRRSTAKNVSKSTYGNSRRRDGRPESSGSESNRRNKYSRRRSESPPRRRSHSSSKRR